MRTVGPQWEQKWIRNEINIEYVPLYPSSSRHGKQILVPCGDYLSLIVGQEPWPLPLLTSPSKPVSPQSSACKVGERYYYREGYSVASESDSSTGVYNWQAICPCMTGKGLNSSGV